ncbi:MAG: PSD1 domain-containing protein [Planctomycetes bacterium]|nr:PSD1 domain-containing protein [Planctomycetota bacterium]
MTLPRIILVVLLLLPAVAKGQTVDYLRDIKPILASSCYTCHGAIKQKGGLRLDTVALMREGGDHGSVLKDGLILKHIRGDKGFRHMPPKGDGEPLKPAQLTLIKRWIDEGAPHPQGEKPEADPRDHWAFRPPVRPGVPKVKRGPLTPNPSPGGRGENPIDAFIAAEHEKRGLTPQGPAEHGIWLRRVYLDLIGLPPTREEQAAFLKECANAKPQAAYEHVVDRLLASPQYGERWGRHWMDVWRYSDWWGLGAELRNSQRHIWHWRDWIVESLNKDKGYDQMLREMIAADELYPTDDSALRGTGFLARHYFLFNRTTWLDETIEHTSKAFMGLTLNCCKCHDHKYDAFSQVDYYRFRALFEPYQIRTDLVPGESNVMKNGVPRVYDANLSAPTFLHIRGNEAQPDKNRKITPGLPSLLIPSGLSISPIRLPPEAHQPGLRAFILGDLIRQAEQQRAEGEKELAQAKARLALAPKFKTTPAPQPKPKELVRDNFANVEASRWKIKAGDWKIKNGQLVQEKAGNVRGALRLIQNPPTDFEARVKFATLGGDTYRSVGISFDVDKDHEALVYLTPHPPARVQVSFKRNGKHVYPADGGQAHAVPLNTTHEVVLRVRGTLLNVSVNGKPPLVYRLPIARHLGGLELITFDAAARFEEFVLSTLPADVPLVEGVAKTGGPLSAAQARAAVTIAERKIAHAEALLAALKARAAAIRAMPVMKKQLAGAAARAEKQQMLAQAEWNLARIEAGQPVGKMTLAQAKAAVSAARKALANPGETFTPLIGSVKTRENNLESDANRLKPFPTESTGRRAAFAKWLTDRKNPLAARVAVNHIWARHFGTPLVATVFDFGRKGAAPTHPDLLDWLAVELMEPTSPEREQGGKPSANSTQARGAGGWSMKRIHRLIVLSSVYRMTSSTLNAADANRKLDPENKFYWRMNAQRMQSQVVRDSLLHLAGELDMNLGGPAIEMGQQDASRRRSLYFFHSAIQRNKFLETFDEADPLDCYRRQESIIPQQALALSNSKLAATMAIKIATTLEKTVAAKDYSREAFAWILGYAPTAGEVDACDQALRRWIDLNKARPDAQHRARARLIQALLNHNDFITIR